jgi:hypothetical protein
VDACARRGEAFGELAVGDLDATAELGARLGIAAQRAGGEQLGQCERHGLALGGRRLEMARIELRRLARLDPPRSRERREIALEIATRIHHVAARIGTSALIADCVEDGTVSRATSTSAAFHCAASAS